MADNVAITAGSGTTIATDDCGAGGHVQVVKLAISTDGSVTYIPADATYGLDVDVARVQGSVTVQGSATGEFNVAGMVQHDAPVSTFGPVLIGARASAAAPSDVSADGDAVRLWAKRNGSLVVELSTNGIVADVLDRANSNPLAVAIVDLNGNQLNSFGGTQYAVDAVAGGGDSGTLALVVRDDALGALTPADGDYTQLRVTSQGRLWTSAKLEANSGVEVGDIGAILTPVVAVGGETHGSSFNYSLAGQAGYASSTAPTNVDNGDVVHQWHQPNGAQCVTLVPQPNVGASVKNSSSSDGATALTNTAQEIKASAGNLLAYFIYNPNSSAAFVHFYNLAAGSVTVGSTNPLFMLTIPAQSAANLALPYGIAFSTAMSWAATSTAGGNGAPTTALDATAFYN